MDAMNLVGRVRDHYVAQFVVFADEQRQSCTRGGSEVKLQLGEKSTLFWQLYCADFLKDEGEVLELSPERVLSFNTIIGSVGRARVSIESLRWDDVQIHHDIVDLPSDNISEWFQMWFDIDEKRHQPGAQLSEIIHSLLVQPGMISVDFGTAPTDAFWDMLALLEGAGATDMRITSSRAEPPADS
jgi:hypothetical protein